MCQENIRVGHIFLDKFGFGALCTFLEPTDAIIPKHIDLLYLQYQFYIATFRSNDVSSKKKRFLHYQVLEHFARLLEFR